MGLVWALILGAILLITGPLQVALAGQDHTGTLEITPKASEAPDATVGESIKLYSTSKALVIGIDNYSAGWPKLSVAVKDAKAVAEALKLQGFEVTLVSNPTREELERAFRDFFIIGGTDADARLFVWFAGHGHTIKSGGGDDEGYIVPRDAPSPLVSDTEFRRMAISLRRFGEYMREARAKHVLAVFDSCFGGSVFNVARALPPPAITQATAQPVRQFISSGDADQVVGDDGTFRRLFIDALQGAEPSADINKDGYLTGTGLGQFLQYRMTNLTGKRQTPRYGKLNAQGYDRGDFVFHIRESKTAQAAPQIQVPLSEAAQTWGDLKEAKNVTVLEAFRKQYGQANPSYDMLAKLRIVELERDARKSSPTRRVALVIGNSGYKSVSALSNPGKDSSAIATELIRLGFDVTEQHDLSFDGMRHAFAEFEDKASRADWAVVYYAGHGMEVSGKNWLVPIDAVLAKSNDVPDEAIGLDRVRDRVRGAKKLRFIILDACRNNPFLSRMAFPDGNPREISRGLARVEPQRGEVIFYAARDGSLASDGKGDHSPFAAALLKHMSEKGLELGRFFRRVSSTVWNSTAPPQEPFVYSSLPDEDFYFELPE